jgi:hypothetical protein
VACAGAAVKNNEWVFSSGTIPCPIERNRRSPGESRLARLSGQ